VRENALDLLGVGQFEGAEEQAGGFEGRVRRLCGCFAQGQSFLFLLRVVMVPAKREVRSLRSG